jgi:type II secretory pathway pseudopilin PulG
MVIVLVIGVIAVAVMAGVGLIVITRLRRSIKSQFQTIENLLDTVRASQNHDDPGKPS